MLVDVSTGRRVARVPYEPAFAHWCSRLSQAELAAIRAELAARIDGNEVHTSSWMPGANWMGGPFQPIFEKACRQDANDAARCFGLFVWEAFMAHEESWGFGRYQLNDTPINGITYFRLSDSTSQ